MIISDDGDYQLYASYSNGAMEAPGEYRETGKLGELMQMEDGTFEAEVLSVEASDINELSFTMGYRDTFFTDGSTVHFYPAGTSANVLEDDVWIGMDKVSFTEDEYSYFLNEEEWIDANGNFNQYVIWMEGSDATFIANASLNDDEIYFEANSAYAGKPIFYDWGKLEYMNEELPTDGDRIVFRGKVGEYSTEEVLMLQGLGEEWAYGDMTKTYQLIILDMAQTMELHSAIGDGFRSDEVLMIDIRGIDNIEQYYGQYLTFSIDPNKTYWPSDAGLPLGQPHTSDIHILD